MAKGGYRKGSGRKAFCEDVVSVHWRVSENAKTWMKQKAVEDGVSIGNVLDKLIKHYQAISGAVKIAENAVNIADVCAAIEKNINNKVLEKIKNAPVEYVYPEAQVELEKIRHCSQFRRPVRINGKVVQIINYNVGVDSFNHGKMNITFDTLPLDDYDKEYVLDIDVSKLR